MAQMIHARGIVGSGFPPEEGTHLADNLLQRKGVDWAQLQIDLRGCPAGLLISAFFNGFLQRIVDKDPSLLDKAREIQWQLDYPFQKENIGRWMHGFRPHTDNGKRA